MLMAFDASNAPGTAAELLLEVTVDAAPPAVDSVDIPPLLALPVLPPPPLLLLLVVVVLLVLLLLLLVSGAMCV
jgi:hypothetical protein